MGLMTRGASDVPDAARSVYQRALGEDFASLDTHLQGYFGPIPIGHVGGGRGTYDIAGSRLLFLRPIFALFARRHVLFPELGRDVPFTITNTPSSTAVSAPSGHSSFPSRPGSWKTR